jgi:heme A synthase
LDRPALRRFFDHAFGVSKKYPFLTRRENIMRSVTVYRILAYVVAAGVMVQAMVMVFAVDGLGKWVDGGGVLDKAAAAGQQLPFPEAVGFSIHGMNGMLVIPLIALLLVVFSFFAKIPGGVKWAGLVLLLVVVQIALGLGGHAIPAVGALHGLNALLLFSAAVYTARRGREPARPAADRNEAVATPV